MSMNRRDFFKVSGAAALPLLAPRLAFGRAKAGTDTLVVVFQRGGMDALNVVVPHGDANYYTLRPRIGIARPGTGTGAALDLDGFFGFNPALAPMLPLYRSGKLAAVHATGFTLGSRSHFDCQDFMERAAAGSQLISDGWLNRHLALSGVDATFESVAVGNAVQLALRGSAPSIGLANIAGFTIRSTSQRKAEISALFDAMFAADVPLDRSARQAVSAVAELAVENPAQYPVANGASYPSTVFGNQLMEVAQLIKSDLGLSIACVDIGGWDHHENEAQYLDPLLDELSRALVAFDTDLGARMANVTVLTMTEFGRRAAENASEGTDHGSGYAMFLMGGGVAGGTVYRDWPGLAESSLFRGDLAITTDYRTVLAEVLEKRMGGTDLARVFPDFTPQPRLGAVRAR